MKVHLKNTLFKLDMANPVELNRQALLDEEEKKRKEEIERLEEQIQSETKAPPPEL